MIHTENRSFRQESPGSFLLSDFGDGDHGAGFHGAVGAEHGHMPRHGILDGRAGDAGLFAEQHRDKVRHEALVSPAVSALDARGVAGNAVQVNDLFGVFPGYISSSSSLVIKVTSRLSFCVSSGYFAVTTASV